MRAFSLLIIALESYCLILFQPVLFLLNAHEEHIMWNARLDEAQVGIKIAGRNISNFRYTDDTILMAESEEELKSLLTKGEEESEKVGLKFNIQTTKTMASGSITSWQIDGDTMQTVTDFIFLSSKITADGDCSHEIKRRLLLGRKAMTNLDSILKRRDIADKGPSKKSYGFSSSMYGCESWTFKLSTEELMLLNCGVGEDSWESLGQQGNQSQRKSVLNIHWKDCCWSWSFNTLATWDEELTLWQRPWCWERLKAEGDDRGWDGWIVSPSHELKFKQALGVVMDREAWHATVHGVAKSRTQLRDWTEIQR